MTRFDEVDDPADIGKEQQQIQETKLRQLTLEHLKPGTTQTIARARDDTELKQRRDGGYPPGPPPPPQPGMMRRMIATGAEQVGTTIKRGMQAYDDYAARQAERAEEHANYLENQQWAIDNEDRNIRARAEQADQERMSWFSSHSDAASSQSLAILNGPASTVYHYVGHDDDDGPELPSGAASSSGGGWFDRGLAAINSSHQAAKDRAEEKKKTTKSHNYLTATMGSAPRGPDPGGGGGTGKYMNEKQVKKLTRRVASNLFL
jgi:hypothetical protein